MLDTFNSKHVAKPMKESISCVLNDKLLFSPLLSL